jgi:two-component sensor histidine kinase
MHPILRSVRRLLLYLLVWIPLALLPMYLVRTAAALSWGDAAATVGPACFVFAFACLSPWYIARSRPLAGPSLPGLIGTHLVSAAAASGLLVLAAWTAAHMFGRTVPPPLPLFSTGVLLYILSVGLHYAILLSAQAHETERRAAEARTLAREAELQTLRFQLNPHFLFNSLHSISALTAIDAARAREMCVLLAGFLRSSLKIGNLYGIPLREEIALAASYLEIERVRFGERLRIERDIEARCEDCTVPPLLLQPLVENAVKHGISAIVDGGIIRIAARRVDGDVIVTVENDFDPEANAGVGTGIGLTHVRRRLQVRYGDAAGLQAGPHEALYRVVLRFPCESSMASSSRA